MKHSVKDYVLATRPWSFPASAMPVTVTMAWLFYIGAQPVWWLGLWALLTIVMVHAAGNVWSDYFDYKTKVDREDTYGVKILTSGMFRPKEMLTLSIVLQVVALLSGIALVYATGIELLWIGLGGVMLSLLYPPLKYAALGDVVIYLCYGLLPVMGTSFIATDTIHWQALWLSIPVGLITISILHANNTRDIETDRRAGINTFAMLIGRHISAYIYCAEVLVPFAFVTLMVLCGYYSWSILLVWIVFPVAVKNIQMMIGYRTKGVESFASLDEASAKLQLAFSLLLSIGFIAAALI